MARNFDTFFFQTPLSYQCLANRETELRSGDLRVHGRALKQRVKSETISTTSEKCITNEQFRILYNGTR